MIATKNKPNFQKGINLIVDKISKESNETQYQTGQIDLVQKSVYEGAILRRAKTIEDLDEEIELKDKK